MVIGNEEDACNSEEDAYEWSDSDDVGGVVSSGGVIEFKRDTYNKQQGVAEMLRAVGDIIAMVLAKGDRVDSAVIFGLAANYKTERAALIKLTIDFVRSDAHVILSPDALQLHPALNWLLTSINLS